MRHGIIDPAANVCLNVIDYDSDLSGQTPPGFEPPLIAEADPNVGPGWLWNGSRFVEPVEPLPPPETVIPSAVFFGRFMQLGVTGAVWAACAADATGQLGAGLTHGLALGSIDLLSPETQQWIGGLIAAGALTAEQGAAVLKP